MYDVEQELGLSHGVLKQWNRRADFVAETDDDISMKEPNARNEIESVNMPAITTPSPMAASPGVTS